jgi:hypothetical protein
LYNIKNCLKQSDRTRFPKTILLLGLVLAFAFNTEVIMKAYSQPTPAPIPAPQGSQGIPPQPQQPQQLSSTPQQQQQLQQLQQVENQGQQRLQQLQQQLEQIQQRLLPASPQAEQPQQPQPTPSPQLAPLTPQQQQQLLQQQQQLLQQLQQIQQQLEQVQFREQQVQQPQLQTSPPPAQTPQQQQQIPITVKFTSIRIADDEDPFPWGTGEWTLDAFVSGQKVPLSADKFLNSANGGTTYQFPATAQATVSVPRNGFLTINTVGVEEDGCTPKPQLIPQVLPSQVTNLLKTGGLPGLSTAAKYLDTLNPALGLPLPPGAASILSSLGLDPSKLISSIGCALNANDSIGDINQVYPGPDFGRGIKTEKSTSGSFELTYSITPSA